MIEGITELPSPPSELKTTDDLKQFLKSSGINSLEIETVPPQALEEILNKIDHLLRTVSNKKLKTEAPEIVQQLKQLLEENLPSVKTKNSAQSLITLILDFSYGHQGVDGIGGREPFTTFGEEHYRGGRN